MLNVFMLQWKRLIKQPLLVLLFIGLTVLFVYFMGGAQINSTVKIPVYSETLTEAELTDWIERLNKDASIIFEPTDYETAKEDIRMNEIGFALELEEDTYRILAGRQDEQLPVIEQQLNQILTEQFRLEEVRKEFPTSEIEVKDFITLLESQLVETGSAQTQYQLQILVGMAFYFSVYTILFLQISLVEEKRMGTWNRLIFSPISKTKLYLGHLSYYYLVGLVQILLSFYILTNLLGIDLGTNYLPMAAITLAFLFAIVSLGILITALVPSPQSLQVVIPIITTSMAMLSGAFWPLEIVSNRFLLFIAELMPLKHGLQGLIDAILYEPSISELLQPIGILLLMGILFMGSGINLMERVSKT
ncbi:ABC transporter permease [Desemzia sp. RIT804]|uniref:ABC transporter permease n=1 Tax=Desemzia sp. RIT 804 TaxID=2810209 RepID=UPI00194F4FA4|nr:ABC transporter permease [Desemzia sp. RIT 804]MBM6615656.1 ABC transporter permease [Desemzia sp. RIT 804]